MGLLVARAPQAACCAGATSLLRGRNTYKLNLSKLNKKGKTAKRHTTHFVRCFCLCGEVFFGGVYMKKFPTNKRPNTGPGFFDVEPKSKEPSEFDKTTAKQLIKQLRKAGLVRGSHPTREWAAVIYSLRVTDREPAKHITKVLDWYAAHHNDCRIKLHLAGQLRRKFATIAEIMHKAPAHLQDLKIGKDAKRLAERLRRLYVWPADSAKQLDALCQVSLDNLNEFRVKIEALLQTLRREEEQRLENTEDGEWIESKPEDENLWRYIHYVFYNEMPDPENYVEAWLKEQKYRVEGWSNWNGVLKPFETTDKRFDKRMYDRSVRFCGECKWWDVLKQRLYENH